MESHHNHQDEAHNHHAAMNHDKMDQSKMHHDHGSIPMGMAGHDHHKMMIEDFKKRFWVSLDHYYTSIAFIADDTEFFWL